MTNREIIQKEAIDTWLKNPKSTLNLCTGLGKTYISLQIANLVYLNNPNCNILIIVPTQIIRDEVFPNEFKKFNLRSLEKICKIECIQTVYKWGNTKWDLIICDEIHNYLPQKDDYEYYKFFENNSYDRLLGLSASIDDQKLIHLNKIAPISYSLNIDQAVKLGIVSPFTIYNLAVKLTEEEQKEYDRVQKLYNFYEYQLGGIFNAYNNAKKYLKDGTDEQKKHANIFYAMMKKRKTLLNDASNKVLVAKQIIAKNPTKYGIIFSESINQCNLVEKDNSNVLSYHSKLKKKERLNVINKLNDKRTKIHYISAVKALNEGLSINSIELAIILAGNSKVKDMIQRIGRSCRFVDGKNAIIIRLYVPYTQDAKWVEKSQKDFDKSNIKYINNIEEIEEWRI